MTSNEVSWKQLKAKTTGAERFEDRSSSSVVKMYSRHLEVKALKHTQTADVYCKCLRLADFQPL